MNIKTKNQTLLLVDGHSLAFRSFYAFTKAGEGGLSTKDGIPTSVTYGFLKALLDNCRNLSPKGIAIAFDTAEPTFRHKSDPNYKANRDVAPDIFFQDLKQLQLILKEQLDLPLCISPGFEADDVLGTLAYRAADQGWTVRILTGDRDLFQLVDDSRDIAVLYMGGGPYAKNNGPKLIKEQGVIEKLGVSPNKVVDLKALTGDSSDNIPGVKGVGPKTAINLLNENQDLDGVYKALENLGSDPKASSGSIKGAVRNKLNNSKEDAYLSKFLARILVNIEFTEEPRFKLSEVDLVGLEEKLKELELYSLVRQISNFGAAFSEGGFKENTMRTEINNQSSNPELDINKDIPQTNSTQDFNQINPSIISSKNDLVKLLNCLMDCQEKDNPVAFDTETTDLNPFKSELVGLGFCWGDDFNQISYIPICHKLTLGIEDDTSNQQLSLDFILHTLKPWLVSSSHPKVLQNSKYDRLIMLRHGIQMNGVVFDTLIADYICDSSAKHGLDSMSIRYFGYTPLSFSDLVPRGKTIADVSIKEVSLYCGMDVFLTRKLYFILQDRLKNEGDKLSALNENVELPLESVLASMESTGIRIDKPYLKSLSIEISSNLAVLNKTIMEHSGKEFNLSSPKQLGEILFETLQLDRKKSRKTKTGWSTDAKVLDKLQFDHPIIPLIIEHRTLSKLLTTYVDALPKLVEPETNRVHTDFNQAVTATGRLSSSNPNLQNIPIKTDFSRQIRKAFLPQENWKLLSADYSQIELRILAHLSQEETLIDAYKNGIDVHELTAKILLEKDVINADERRLGKTINFGVIYGMGAQRFARSTGLNIQEAKSFLQRYKLKYKNVFNYLEMQERLALSRGYVETILGRRRYFAFDHNGLGRLIGKDPMDIDLDIARRAGMEAQQLRAAANAPIQGSSADLIKVAMIEIHNKFLDLSLPARMLLQVHDELVFEVDPSSIDQVLAIIVNTMENAVNLTIPLVVETGIGHNWMEAK